MVLGKLPVPGRPTVWIIVGQGPTGGAGEGCLDIFSLVYHFCFLTPSLWETARYRLKYCLKGPLSPNQPKLNFIMGLRMFRYLAICPRTPTLYTTGRFHQNPLKNVGVAETRTYVDKMAKTDKGP